MSKIEPGDVYINKHDGSKIVIVERVSLPLSNLNPTGDVHFYTVKLEAPNGIGFKKTTYLKDVESIEEHYVKCYCELVKALYE